MARDQYLASLRTMWRQEVEAAITCGLGLAFAGVGR